MTNLLKNPSFDQGMPKDWQTYQTGTAHKYTYPDTGKVNVGISTEYETREIGKKAAWVQNVDLSRKYKLSGWVKTENIVSDNVDGGTNIVIDWKNASGIVVGTSKVGVNPIKGTNAWALIETEVTANPGATQATILLLLNDCSGKVWFDDVTFTEI